MKPIRKPKLGRAWDSRMTEGLIGSTPGLRGVPPFDPEQDVDLVDALNERLEEGERVLAAERERVAQALADTAQNNAAQNARLAALNLPPWVVTDNQPGYVEITQLRAGAVRPGTVTLPNSGITLATVEVDLV